MYYLYGAKTGGPSKLVATFDGEQRLLSYVRWATVSTQGQSHKFEQGSSLAGYQNWSYTQEPRPEDDVQAADHNPSPNMM
jgi:hypothetical protein